MRKSVFFYYLKENKKSFILLVTIFIFGIVIGIYLVNHANDSQKLEIYNYVDSLKENIKSSNSINRTTILILSIKKNIVLVMLIVFFSCTLLGSFLIYLMIFYKGFSVGYTISSIIASLGIKNGMLFVVVSLLLQNLIFLPMIFILSVNGINFYKNIKMNGLYTIKKDLFRYCIIFCISIVIAIICSFIEVYISTNFLIFLKKFL